MEHLALFALFLCLGITIGRQLERKAIKKRRQQYNKPQLEFLKGYKLK